MKKRLLSLLLALVLVLSMVPVGVIAEGEHVHCLCGQTTTLGTACTECGSEAVEWTGTDDMPTITEPGYYYLTADVSVEPFFVTSGEFAFCLCGHDMVSAAGKRIIDVSGGAVLSITDCTENVGSVTGAASQSANGSTMRVNAGSVLNLYNGKVTGNTAASNTDGIIYVAEGTTATIGGTFNMYGGEISDNTARRGAVYAALATGGKQSGVIRILGGTITGNTGTGTGNTGGGAGVMGLTDVEVGGDARIYGNTAATGPADVYIRDDQGCKLIVSSEVPLTEGASICYGTRNAEADTANLQHITGAPTAWDSAWVKYDGGKVGYADGKFFIDTSVPEGHIHCLCGAETNEGNTCAECGSQAAEWTGIDKMPAVTEPGYYYLTADVSVEPFFVTGGEFAFCLCGHDMVSAAGKRMFDVSGGAVMSFTDCSENPGTVTGVTGASTNGMAMRVNAGSTLNLYGGRITGNTGASDGLIYVAEGTATTIGGTFNMYGGEISGNTTRRGAVYAPLATGGKQPGVVRILGGTITGNTGTGTGNTGGGAGVLGLTDVEVGGDARIYGNTAATGPADVYIRDDQGCKLIVSSDVPLVSGANICYGTRNAEADTTNLQFITGSPSSWTMGWVTYDGDAVGYKNGKFYTTLETVYSDHDHDGRMWISVTNENGQLPGLSGYYVLDGDVQLPGQLVLTKGTEITLCLNGHTLTAAAGASHFDLRAGSKLTICDCTGRGVITGGTGANGGAIRARAGSELYLYSGTFTGNAASGGTNGGVVYMDAASAEYPGAVFHMYGGTLCGNTGTYGAAVRLGAPASGLAGPTFRMEGGTICHNESPNYGGAIHAAGGATVELIGGVIENNSAAQGGGAVSINGNSAVTLSGTVIRNNTATTWGGGLYIKTGAVLNMTGGEVSGNSAKVGAGLLLESQDTTLNLQGGAITGNKAGAAGGAGVYASTNTIVNMTGGQITENVSEAGGGGIALNRAFGSFTGGEISGNTANGGAGMSIQGGEVTLGKVTICDNVSSGSSGGIYVARSGEYTANIIIDGARILNNTCQSSGGGMFVYMNGNTVTMESGLISGNKAKDGGGVVVQRVCTFTMNGGEISNNRATNNAGGYYASIDSVFEMNGGKITQNYAAKNGGGLYALRATVTLNKGSIHDNIAQNSVGGVYFSGSTGYINGAWITSNRALEGSGGGVMVAQTTATIDGVKTKINSHVVMTGGSISYNTTPKAGAGLLLQNDGSVFDLYGGKISQNVATKFAGGVYVGKGAMFNMHGGEVSYNVTENDVAGGIRHDGGGGNYTGGEIFGNSSTRSGGGIVVGGTDNVVNMKNVKIYDNTAKVAAGILLQGKNTVLNMENCEIYNNQATQDGAGIYVYTYVTLNATDCHIHDNTAQNNGGAVWSWATSYVNLNDCLIENNKAVEGQGGAVWTRGDGFNITGCTIRNNTAAGNGGAVCTGMMGSATPRYTPGLKIADTRIEGNVSGGQGGGLYQSSGSEGNLKNVQFIGNTAAAEGGALWAVDEFTMHSVTATGNTSGGEGHAIYLADSGYDGHSFFAGLMKVSGSMIVRDNQGGNLYLGEKTSLAIGEQGLAEDAYMDITMHSGLLTDWVWGAYNYEGGDLVYTITYGDRSITDPELHTEEEPVEEPTEEPDGEPTEAPTEVEQEAPKGNIGLIVGIIAIVAVIVAAALIIIMAAKKKKSDK